MLASLFLHVLNLSIIGTYAIVVIIICRQLCKSCPKIFAYILWSVAGIRLITDATISNVVSYLPNNLQPISEEIILEETEIISSGVVSHANPMQGWITSGSYVWILGMLVMVVVSLMQYLKLRKQLSCAVSIEKNIYLTDGISTPFVMGIINPKIYLPSTLLEVEREYIVMHEVCHIKRLDHITSLLAYGILAIHWFNPMVWIAFSMSRKDMEMSCDEAVLRKVGEDIRREYSNSLLQFSTGRKLMMVTPLACGEHETKERVVRVMKYKKPMIGIMVVSTIIVGSCGFGLLSSSASDEEAVQQEEDVTEIKSVLYIDETDAEEAANVAMEEIVELATVTVRDEGDETYSVTVLDGSSSIKYYEDLNGLDLQNLEDMEQVISEAYQKIYEW